MDFLWPPIVMAYDWLQDSPRIWDTNEILRTDGLIFVRNSTQITVDWCETPPDVCFLTHIFVGDPCRVSCKVLC